MVLSKFLFFKQTFGTKENSGFLLSKVKFLEVLDLNLLPLPAKRTTATIIILNLFV